MSFVKRSASSHKIIASPSVLNLSGGKAWLFFLIIGVILVLGIFTVKYNFQKTDQINHFSLYSYIKDKLGSVGSK